MVGGGRRSSGVSGGGGGGSVEEAPPPTPSAPRGRSGARAHAASPRPHPFRPLTGMRMAPGVLFMRHDSDTHSVSGLKDLPMSSWYVS